VKDTLLNPAREETYTFLAAFFQEMAALFPDEYIHIGGDENNGRQWLANPEIQAFMRAHGLPDTHALQTYFNRRLLAILTRLQKKMVGWDEILAAALPTSTVVIQAWRSKERLWSPPAHCTPEHLDRRLARVSLHLEELGLTHEK